MVKANNPLVAIKNFFGMTMKEFKAEWKPLSVEEKEEFKKMISELDD